MERFSRGSPQRFRPRFELLEDRSVPDAVPVAALTGIPAEPLLGESFSFGVTFDNTSPSDTGFGPYIDLFLPKTGADGGSSPPDDGISFASATYLGAPVQATVLTLTAAGVPHPFARDTNGNPVVITPPPGFQAGDQLVVLTVPFGSFTPTQPPANLTVTVAVSDLADVGTPLPLRAQAAFRFGNDALDNPSVDPTITGPAVTSAATPALFRLTKTYLGPEDETTSGPNFPRQYRVSIDLADGQTITDLDLTDILPPELQFVTAVSTSPAATITSTPSTLTPGGTLTANFASVVGTGAAVDAQVTFQFFVPRLDGSANPILNPSTGDPVTVSDDASATANWSPLDLRDPPQVVVSDTTPDDHILTIRSLAVQKRSAIVVDTGAPGLTPGDTVEYTLDFQISDYYAFQNLVLTDLFSDGQSYVVGSAALAVTDGHLPGTTTGPMATGNVVLTPNFSGGSDRLQLLVSPELVSRGFTGQLIGGAIPTGGGTPVDGPTPPFGPTTGRVTFRTVVQDEYEFNPLTNLPPPTPLKQGDPISNAVTLSGDLLDVTTLVPNGNSENDNSSANQTIVRGTFTKTVYAINGIVGTFPPSTELRAGDALTYRLRYQLPTADVENLRFNDFLPLPIINVSTKGAITAFDDVVSGTAPVAGRAKFGPADTFRGVTGIVPGVTSNTVGNSLTFTYGTYDDPSNAPVTIDILFTVTISTDPFADDLILSNLGQAVSNNSVGEVISGESIGQITLREPELAVTKGVVAAANPDGVFTPTPVGPVAFNAPGTTGARFAGTITSASLTTTPIDSNLANVDASDLVTYAITVVNTGGEAAFDVLIRDTLPPGTVIPNIGAFGYNLRVTDGAGNLKPFQIVGQGLFDPAGGIRLVDVGGVGALGPAANDGSDVVVVTFDMRLGNDVTVLQKITDTSTVANYAAVEGGPNFVGDPLTDDATVTVSREDLLAKQLVGTSIVSAFNSNTEAVIGELVTYTVTLTVPEASMPKAVIADTLDAQLAFVDLQSVVVSPGVSFTGSSTPLIENAGRNITFDFGDITNANRDNSVTETIVLTYRAVVLNVTSAQANVRVNNLARLTFTGLDNPKQASAANVTIIEPQVVVDKSATVNGFGTVGDAGDPVVYTITLRNPPGSAAFTADAFDVTFADDLPFQAGNGSLIVSPVLGVTDTAGLVTAADFELVGDNTNGWTVRTPAGTSFDLPVDGSRTITLTVSGTLPFFVTPGQVIVNEAGVQWTSLPGSPGPISPSNPNSVERTGTGVPAVNDYRTSDRATVSIQNVALTKSIVATSETATADPERVVVGEIVRFRLQAAVPESQSNPFQFLDQLVSGFQFLDDGTARIAFVADAGDALTSTAIPSGTPGLNVFGNQINVDNITPTAVVPAGVIRGGPFVDGTDVTFDLGTVSNGGTSDPDQEFIVLEFNVLVTNVIGNRVNVPLVNTGTVVVGGVTNATGPATVIVAEPGISAVSKTVVGNPLRGIRGNDAGDRVSYSTEYINNPGTGSSVAYDVRLIDPLVPGKMVLDPASVRVFRNGTQIFTGFANASSVTGLDVTVDVVDVGDDLVVAFDTILTNAVVAGEVLTNTADLHWTSLPGPRGTLVNPTGSETPGSPGTGVGERTGANGPGNGLNNYAAVDSADIDIAIPDFEKSIATTSPVESIENQFLPGIPDFIIGEIVTYRLTATLQEGTTTLTVQDFLPNSALNGFVQYLSSSVVAVGANLTGSALNVSDSGTVAGLVVTFDFGTVVNSADNLVDDRDRIVVQVTAQVLNVPENVAGDPVLNVATLDYGGADPLLDVALAQIIEPTLSIDKIVFAPPSGSVDAGDTVTYQVTVGQQDPPSTAIAFNVLVSESLPTGLTLVPGSVVVVFDPNYPSSFYTPPIITETGNGYTVLIDYLDHPDSPFAQGITNQAIIQYRAVVDPTFAPGLSILNTVDLSYDSFYEPSASNPTVSRNYTDTDDATITLNTNSITGVIYVDANNNGIYESGLGETLITDSATLTLTGISNAGVPISRSVTTTTGSYLFDLLPASDPLGYTITQVNQPLGIADGRDTPGTPFGGTGTLGGYPRDAEAITQVVVPPGSNLAGTDYNFGELPPATLGDFVWDDLNGNGRQDTGEPGLDGLVVTLTGTNPAGGTLTLTTTTAGGGAYSFTGLRPETYAVTFTTPSGYVYTIQNAPGVPADLDSDVNRVTGIALVNLGVGETNDTIDAGMYTGATLSGFVYRDFDINGIREPNGQNPETGIVGVTITLTGVDPNGTALPTLTTTTLANGSYQFGPLPAGTYAVAETQPPSVFVAGLAGFYDGLDTVGTVGGTVRGSQPVKNALAVELGVGESGIEYNFGENPPGDPFGFVYIDLNINGIRDPGEPGIPGVTITISGIAFQGTPLQRPLSAGDAPNGLVALTDANGRWEFAPIPPGVYSVVETQPPGFLDGREEDADPNGPFTVVVGNDRFDNLVLLPFPVRGAFNFGELLPGSVPPFVPDPRPQPTKRDFLASTPEVALFSPEGLGYSPQFNASRGNGGGNAVFATANGPGAAPQVRVFDFATSSERFRFLAYDPSWAGGVRVATGDVTGDGVPDIVTAPGPGGGPHVKVFDGVTGHLAASFFAFESNFSAGLFVAVANGEIIVGAGAGGGPRVSGFGLDGIEKWSTFAFESSFRGGVTVAAGDVDGDRIEEVIVGAGAGGGPRVVVLAGRTRAVREDFYAFEPNFTGGVFVAAGDANGDGRDEIVVGPGAGGGPVLAIFDGNSTQPVTRFFAYPAPDFRGGGRVDVVDANGDGRSEVVAAPGPVAQPWVRLLSASSGNPVDEFLNNAEWLTGGVFVG